MIFDDIFDKIDKATNIALFPHINADLDAIGSCIALKLVLEKMGKNVAIFCQKPYTKNYRSLGIEKHIVSKKLKFDLAIGLDSPTTKRFGIFQKKFESIKNSIAIDHHPDFEFFADTNYLDEDCSSVCLILFRMFKYKSIKLDKVIAKCLYIGMATDTGRFLYGNLNVELFSALTELFSYGFDYNSLNYNVFQKESKNEFELFRYGLSKFCFFNNDQICLCRLDDDIFKKTNTNAMDTYRITDQLTNLAPVKIAGLMSQVGEREYLVSVRTKEGFSAEKVAKTFGGGGHLRAAGCKLCDYGDNAFKSLLTACRNELGEKSKWMELL